MNILYDKFPHRDVILCTYSKLNSIKDGYAFINVKRDGFSMHLMQHLSQHLRRKQTPFSPQLRKSTGKGKLPCCNSKPAYCSNGRLSHSQKLFPFVMSIWGQLALLCLSSITLQNSRGFAMQTKFV